MSAPENAKGHPDKSGWSRTIPPSILVLVAVFSAHAVATENTVARQPEDSIISVATSPSGALVATAPYLGLGNIKITDIVSGKVVNTLDKQISEPIIAFSPEDQLLLTRDEKGLELWSLDVKKGQAISKGYLFRSDPFPLVESMMFSPDGKTLAIGNMGLKTPGFKTYGEVDLWDVSSMKKIRSLKEKMDGVHSLVFSPDGKTLAVGTAQGSAHGSWRRPKGGVQLFDVNTGALRFRLNPAEPISWVEGLAFSPDGKTLASLAPRIKAKEIVGWELVEGFILWDVATGKERSFLKEEHASHYLVFNPDSSILATTDHLWDTTKGTQIANLEKVLAPLTFSKDGKRLATMQFDGNVKWIDIKQLTK